MLCSVLWCFCSGPRRSRGSSQTEQTTWSMHSGTVASNRSPDPVVSTNVALDVPCVSPAANMSACLRSHGAPCHPRVGGKQILHPRRPQRGRVCASVSSPAHHTSLFRCCQSGWGVCGGESHCKVHLHFPGTNEPTHFLLCSRVVRVSSFIKLCLFRSFDHFSARVSHLILLINLVGIWLFCINGLRIHNYGIKEYSPF